MGCGAAAGGCGAGRHRWRLRAAAWTLPLAATAALTLGGCANGTGASLPPATRSPSASTLVPGPVPPDGAVGSSSTTGSTTTLAAVTTTSASTSATSAPVFGPGARGPAVLAIQRRLVALHYWLGTPDGIFGDGTEQAVYALQKAAGITRDGLVGPQTEAALARGVVPVPRMAPGYLIEVDLADDLLMFVRDDKVEWTLNTSTGGGYVYTGNAIARTPVGSFSVYREVDGLVTDNLGQLWRPKFFDGGFAIHGDSYVPPYPVSHGCIRVSNEAIDWIWSHDMAPIGTKVWVYA